MCYDHPRKYSKCFKYLDIICVNRAYKCTIRDVLKVITLQQKIYKNKFKLDLFKYYR